MKSKYTGPKNQAKNQTVPIAVDDPRLSWLKIGQTKARIGAEIDIVGLNGKTIVMGGSSSASGSGSTAVIDKEPGPVIGPSINNNPPINYPGGSGPYILVLTDPTNVTATWSGNTLNVSFTWDASNPANATASQFIVKLTSANGITAQTPFNTFSPISSYNTGGTSYTLPVTEAIITSMFNIFTTNFTSACVMVADPLNNLNVSGMVCTTNVGAHVFAVNPPKIQLSSINSGYTVLYGEDTGTYGAGTALGTFPTGANSVDIWELEGSSSPTPTITLDGSGNPTGWSRVYLGTLDPVNIISPTLNGRWVAARFNSGSGEHTAFCTPQYVIPTAPVTINTKVPTSVSSVSASWSTNDIVINYTLPGATATVTSVSGNGSIITYTAINTFAAGNVVTITGVNPTAYNITGIIVSASSTQFTVAGTTSSSYVSGGSASSTNNSGVRFLATLNAPTGSKGYFYIYPDGTANLNQTATIKKADIYAQFGTYYSSFTGNNFQSISITGIQDSGVSFNVATRTTSLTTYTPTPTVVATLGGYSATFDFSSTPATYAEIYQKYTATAWPSHPDDSVTMSFVSGGLSGTNTMVVNNVKNEHNTTVTQFPEGYLISGTNVPPNTFISAVSGTGPSYTITLSTYDSSNTNVIASNFTGNASGTYTAQGLVYAGSSPGNVFSNFYVPTHIVVQYYDDFGNYSLLSSDNVVTPINTSLSIINNAIPIGSGGAIYIGSSATTGARIVLGPSQKAPDGSQYSGIFAFDGSATTGTAATTSIISNPGAGGYTFETVNAKIADWAISSNKIESLIVSGITKYTGLSASNTSYAFWAGSTTASNSDNSAPFSVSPLGAVKASNIAISGGTLDVGSATAPVTLTTSASQGGAGTGLTFTSTTGVSNGMIVYAYSNTGAPYIPLNTTVASFTGTTVTLSSSTYAAIPSGTVIVFQPSSGAHITSDGKVFATNAYLTGPINANGGYFNGNVALSTNGSLYSAVNPATLPSGTVAGTIFNSNGVAAYTGSSGAYSALLSSPLTANGISYTLFSTAAYLGGWSIDSSRIIKTGISGKGNIVLDSTNGYIYVSDSSVSTYTAGINSVNSTQTGSGTVAFWAGSAITAGAPDPGKAAASPTTSRPYANNFVVRSDGTLFANEAYFNGGLIQTTGSLGSITLDASNGLISMSTNSVTSYILPRNGNLYITAPGTGTPWGSATGTGANSNPPTAEPYFAAGSSFKDPWNNPTSGIGIYTGVWDYFTTGVSDPFITVSKNGTIQLSASPDVGLIVEKGGAVGDANSVPTVMIYTSKNNTAPYKPSTDYGSWATFKNASINLSANTNTFIGIYGANSTSLPAGANVNSIVIQANPNRINGLNGSDADAGGVSAYSGPSKIVLDAAAGVGLWGIPVQGNISMTLGTPYYMGASPLGALPRQRMLVEDPATGQTKLGMAVYYYDTTAGSHTTTYVPGSSSGFIGDLWVTY